MRLAEAGSNCADEPHLIEVTLPMLCSYLPVWWRKNIAQRRHAQRKGVNQSFFPADDPLLDEVDSDDLDGDESDASVDEEKGWGAATGPITTVTADLMNRVLGSVLQLIQNNIDSINAPWMTRIASKFHQDKETKVLVIVITSYHNKINC